MDCIVGLEQNLFLSPQLISSLNTKNIFYLFQVTGTHRSGLLLNNWITNQELELPGSLTPEWTSFCQHLDSMGIQLHEFDDPPMWTGGDRSSFLTANNVYT
jgi:hypothetical protein